MRRISALSGALSQIAIWSRSLAGFSVLHTIMEISLSNHRREFHVLHGQICERQQPMMIALIPHHAHTLGNS